MLLQDGLQILPFEQQAGEWLAIERSRLMKAGYTPAYADGEIAAIAVANGLILVTRNARDFTRFAGLQIENWFDEA